MINNKILRFIRLNWAARTIKSKAFTRITAMTLFAAAMTCLCASLTLPANGISSGQRITLGPENQSAPIAMTVWLKLHNEAALDAMLQQMYDKKSPNYHHWLTPAQFKAQFAPTAQEMATVRSYLAANHLTVTAAHENNHFVVAQGQVADAQRAFNTQINRVMVNGAIHRAAASKPTAAGAAGALIASVQGLSDIRYRANVSRAKNPDTGLPYSGLSPSSVGADGLFFSGNCLRQPISVTFTTNGGLPKATYTGNRYGAPITNTNPPNLPSCGYDAAEMQTAYGVDSLIGQGLDGSGQTIVIVDAFGSNTILEDANLFSQLNGLPPLVTHGPNANFAIVKPTGPVKCTVQNGCVGGWNFETTLDVEWAHAMAPKANIVLVVAVDNSDVNLDVSNLYAIESGFGSVISNSFGIPEVVLVDEAPTELIVENQIAKAAAAVGISLNVSSGDGGDELADDTNNYGIPTTSVDALADSPYVTGVGGTSTFLNKQDQIKLQTGWGLNFVRIADPTPNPPTIPPLFFGFQFGSGGGTSTYFAKPKYQSGLPGSHRMVPDISMNADPETGNEIIVTPDSVKGNPQEVAVFGGTSLSAPMFSGLWAIANQAAINAGIGTPLGQAAPLLYKLPAGAITDVNVTAADTQHNATGTIFNPPNPPQHLSADFLAQPQPPVTRYVSALYQSPVSTRWDVFTFGTDSSLTTGPGWDNVTGLGVPSTSFIQAVVAEAQ